jgi:hypothetical protein
MIINLYNHLDTDSQKRFNGRSKKNKKKLSALVNNKKNSVLRGVVILGIHRVFFENHLCNYVQPVFSGPQPEQDFGKMLQFYPWQL